MIEVLRSGVQSTVSNFSLSVFSIRIHPISVCVHAEHSFMHVQVISYMNYGLLYLKNRIVHLDLTGQYVPIHSIEDDSKDFNITHQITTYGEWRSVII